MSDPASTCIGIGDRFTVTCNLEKFADWLMKRSLPSMVSISVCQLVISRCTSSSSSTLSYSAFFSSSVKALTVS